MRVGDNLLAVCDRCAEGIALANEMDRAGDIDGRRPVGAIASKRSRPTPTFCGLFTLSTPTGARCVPHRTGSCGAEQPIGNVIRDNMRGLQKVPAASRYEIGSHPILGYELIALCPRRGNSMALNPPFSKFRSRVGMPLSTDAIGDQGEA